MSSLSGLTFLRVESLGEDTLPNLKITRRDTPCIGRMTRLHTLCLYHCSEFDVGLLGNLAALVSLQVMCPSLPPVGSLASTSYLLAVLPTLLLQELLVFNSHRISAAIELAHASSLVGLTHLNMSDLPPTLWRHLQQADLKLRNLRRLAEYTQSDSRMESEDVWSMMGCCPYLTSLQLWNVVVPGIFDEERFWQALSRLERLRVCENRLENMHIPVMVKCMPALHSLDVLSPHAVTLPGLISLTALTALSELCTARLATTPDGASSARVSMVDIQQVSLSEPSRLLVTACSQGCCSVLKCLACATYDLCRQLCPFLFFGFPIVAKVTLLCAVNRIKGHILWYAADTLQYWHCLKPVITRTDNHIQTSLL